MCVVNQDSDYWHSKTHPDHQKFLGIHIIDKEGIPIFVVWNVLFLGVADTAFNSTTILKPVQAYASLGILCLIYLDDLMILRGS